LLLFKSRSFDSAGTLLTTTALGSLLLDTRVPSLLLLQGEY